MAQDNSLDRNLEKSQALNDFEQQLQSLVVTQPSSDFFDDKVAKFMQRKNAAFFGISWRSLATSALVLMLSVSIGLNFLQLSFGQNEEQSNQNVTSAKDSISLELMANQLAIDKQHVVLSPPNNKEKEQRYVLGDDFSLIDGSMLSTGQGRLQVSNFFWYGCNYCFNFEQIVNPWQNKQQAENNINFQRIPAVWSDLMLLHARAYFAANEFPNAEAIHQSLFSNLHLNKDAYTSEEALAPLFYNNGINYDDFSAAINSPRTILLADEARQLTKELRDLGLNGVPGLIVNQRYLVKNTNYERMLNVADYLLQFEKERYGGSSDEAVVVELEVKKDGSILSVVGLVKKSNQPEKDNEADPFNKDEDRSPDIF